MGSFSIIDRGLLNNLLIGTLYLLIAQTITWYGTNGQFMWPWFKNHIYLSSILFGGTSCYFFILATEYGVKYFDNNIWPVRILSFCVGIVSFAVLSSLVRGEHMTIKTLICLALAFIIMAIQIFWK
jgi:hypothetical protein